MSKQTIRLALALLVVFLTTTLVGAQPLTLPDEASIDAPIDIGIDPAWVNHSTIRIDEHDAFYRASVDQEIMQFTARRAGLHRITLIDSETGENLAEDTVLVIASDKPVIETPPDEPQPPVEEPPVEEPIVDEQPPEVIIEEPLLVEEPAPDAVAPLTPVRVRPTTPLLTWDRTTTRNAPDAQARTRTQVALPRLVVDDVRRDPRGRYDVRLRAPGYNALEMTGATTLPSNESIEFLPPMGTSTDVVLVENITVDNATVRLAKDSQVDAIAQCDEFLPDNTCTHWTTTSIPFTDYGTYVEFIVPHFSGYAGVHNVTYAFVENTTALLVNTANRLHANLTFSDPSGSQWLIIGYSEYTMNITSVQGRVYLTRDSNTIIASMQKRVTETAETNAFFYMTNYTGDGGTVTFLINASTSAVGGNMTVRRSRIMALRLDDSAAAQHNGSYTGTLTSNVDTVFGDDAGDSLNTTLDVRDVGLYLVYGGATYNSDNTTGSARMRLVMDGAVIKPDTYLEEEDVNTAETHVGSMARIVTLGTGAHTFATQIASEGTSTTDWQYVAVGAIRLTDVYTFWYQNSSGAISTTSTATPQNVANSTNDTYALHNYTIITSGLINAASASRRTDARVYVNNVIRGNTTIRPRDITDYVAAGMVDHVSGVTSLTVNMTVITNNAASAAAMKYADLLIIEVGNYSAPLITTTALINKTGPVNNGTVIRVNATFTNISPLLTVKLQIDSPLREPFNTTANQTGAEWYNASIILNESGLWSFTFFANDTPGSMVTAIAVDAEGTPYIEVNATPVISTVRLSPSTAYAYNTIIGYCNATAGVDRPVVYNYTWFINGTANLTGTWPWASIAVGDNHACSLAAKDRRVGCWGYNSYGQIGYNLTGTNTNVSTLTNDTSAYVTISVGYEHTCGIRAEDGRVLCWGRNTNGRLGNDDSGVHANIPVLTTDTDAYIAVTSGEAFSCGIRANDSQVLCWGLNNHGQQGNNASGPPNAIPTQTTDQSAYRMIDAGALHACGIRANDSRVLCWGNNDYGQLGNNDTGTNQNMTALTNDTSAYFMISVGGLTSCGIRANDSRVLCWGYNANGQLGNNETGTDLSIPTLTNDTTAYLMVSTSGSTTCGIRANDSRVLCWGYNNDGQLGNNISGIDVNIPTLTNDTSAYLEVGVGASGACAVRASDRRVVCWGLNTFGQLGTNNTIDYYKPTLTSDTKPVHGGSPNGQEMNIALLTPRYIAGYNITLQCQAYDGHMWSAPVNTSMIIQDAGPPLVNNVTAISAITPVTMQNVTALVNFTAYDIDGVAGIVDASANFTLRNGSVTRRGSCSPTDLNSTSVRYNCSLTLTYYDKPGTWIVNVSVRDSGWNNASNGTTTATVNNLLALNVSAATFPFGSIAPGVGATAASGPLLIHNRGNVNITWLNITAYTLVNGSSSIQVGNITINSTNNLGTSFVNATPLNVTNSSVNPETDALLSNRSLYLYISVPNGTAARTYTPTQAWEVTTQ